MRMYETHPSCFCCCCRYNAFVARGTRRSSTASGTSPCKSTLRPLRSTRRTTSTTRTAGAFARVCTAYECIVSLSLSHAHTYDATHSAAYAGAHKFQEAADDAAKCIAVNPDFVKGYHRHGVALKGLKKYEEALATLRAGQRKDFNNRDLNKLITDIEPLQAQVEAARRSGLNPVELLKEKGNDAFKAASFEAAIGFYSQAIDASSSPSDALTLSCFNNRAACNQQLSNFSAVIRDCTHVLEFEPENQKALLRRALAYEGLERYPLALQDIRALNSINPNIEVRAFGIIYPREVGEMGIHGLWDSAARSRTRRSTASASTCAR